MAFLFIAAGCDFKKQEIPWGVFGAGAVPAFGFRIYEWICLGQSFLIRQIVLSMGVGAFLLLLSAVSNEAIGKGDGMFFLVSGLYLTFWENLVLFFNGLLLIGVFCLFFTVYRRKQGKFARSDTIPFLPFLIPGGIWMILYVGGI